MAVEFGVEGTEIGCGVSWLRECPFDLEKLPSDGATSSSVLELALLAVSGLSESETVGDHESSEYSKSSSSMMGHSCRTRPVSKELVLYGRGTHIHHLGPLNQTHVAHSDTRFETMDPSAFTLFERGRHARR